MNKNSILFRISLFFFLALIATTVLFKMMYQHEFSNEREKLRVHYHHVAMNVMRWKIGDTTYSQLKQALKKDNITIVDDLNLYHTLQKSIKYDTVSCAKGDFHIYEKDSIRYVIVPPIVGQLLLKDENTYSINVNYIWWLYLTFIFIMLLLFISITVSLYPLKRLQQQIRHFGEGDIEIDFFSPRKDEIAEVSNEFNKSVKKITDILEARRVFIRNVTHEFKTPLTSGKLALELIEDSKSKDVLRNVFTRLELLLKEFVHIEQLTATDQVLEKRLYPLRDILDQASDLLFLEPNSIKHNLSKNMLEVNFELFTFVFKNLMDNALKYSENNDVSIKHETDKLHFISKCKKMELPLEHYLQPFVKSSEHASQSFGLGLYIVNAIIKKHNFSLSYMHKEGYNYFYHTL